MEYNSNYDVHLAQIAALGGDTTKKYDSVFAENLELLRLMEGGLGAKIDDTDTSTGKVWSSAKTFAEIEAVSGGEYLILELETEWTQAKKDARDTLVAKYGNRLQNHLFYISMTGLYVSCLQYSLGHAIFLEMYNDELYYTDVNDNIAIGATIEMTERDRFMNSSNTYGRIEIDQMVGALNTSINTKQATLVSGTNIKTINNNSLLGSGNITIDGGAGVISLTQAEYDALTTVDPTKIYNITDATPSVLEDYTPLNTYNTLVASLPTTYNPYHTVNAQSAGYLPSWNARGQITGYGNYLYQSSGSINGTNQTFYRTTSASLPSIYAPTASGTSGQVLQSQGAGQAPQWVDYRSDATDYIDYDDVSNGTYSTGISTFYNNCISGAKIGPMQMVRAIDHLLPINGDPVTGNLLANTKVCNEDNEAVHLTYTDGSQVVHNITLNSDGTVTDLDATGAVVPDPSTVITGYNAYNVIYECAFVDGTPYEVEYETFTSHSYYLPSSTRLFEANVEAWFFTTEDGVTWKNLHVIITDSTVTSTTTTGTFGA